MLATRGAGLLGGEPTSPTVKTPQGEGDVERLILPDGVDPMRIAPAGDLPLSQVRE